MTGKEFIKKCLPVLQTGKGTTTNALTEFADLYPAIAALAGLPVPGNPGGTSVQPLLNHPGLQWKKAAFSQFPGRWPWKKEPNVMGYTIRTNDSRYTEGRNFKTGSLVAIELYDQARDPDETITPANQIQHKDDIAPLKNILHSG